MRRSQFTDEQIAISLRQAKAGRLVIDSWRRLEITETTFCRWKKYGGLGVPELRELTQLREGNRKPTQRVADLSLDTM